MGIESMGKPDHARLWQIALAGYWLVLFISTHLPREFPSIPGDGKDKWVHVGAFAVLAWLLAMAWEQTTGRLRASHLIAAWVVLAGYAAIDELTQIPVGRTASYADWMADAAGAAIGLFAFAMLRRS
jgi:VanZ family protein